MFDFLKQEEVVVKKAETPKKVVLRRDSPRPNLRKVLDKYRKSLIDKPRCRYLIGPSRIYYMDIEEFVVNYYVPMSREFIDTNTRLKMDTGTFVQEQIQRDLWHIGLLEGELKDGEYVEPYFENDNWGFRGACDGIIDLGKFMSYQTNAFCEPERALLEIKTCPKEKFLRIMCVEDVPEYILWQVEIYMKAWKLDKCVFIFVNLDSFVQKIFVYEYDGQYFKRAKAKSKEAFEYVEKRELPRYQILTKGEWEGALAIYDQILTA